MSERIQPIDEVSACPYPLCRKEFRNQYNLKKHINSHHLKIKPFKCVFCAKAFSYKHSMLHHQVSHEVSNREKITGEVLPIDLCYLLEKCKDPQLRPFGKVKGKRRKRKRDEIDGFIVLPSIRLDLSPAMKLPKVE